MDVIRKFYWETYNIVQAGAPQWMFVMDSSFRGSEVGREGFMRGCPNKAMDKHPYHAWAPWGKIETYYERSCGWAAENVQIEEEVDIPVISGECTGVRRPNTRRHAGGRLKRTLECG